jgi:hypothetical protein
MQWFSPDEHGWNSALNADNPRVPIPVGQACFHCTELITEQDDGFQDYVGHPFHRNCFLRLICGSVAHIERRCSCFVPGSECHDPEGMTLRQAADAAVAAMRRDFGIKFSREGEGSW